MWWDLNNPKKDLSTANTAGEVTFLAKKVTKNAFAYPKVALPTSPFHKFSKHGLGPPEEVCR